MTPATASGTWWLAPAIIAALIAATIGIWTIMVNGRRARVDRQRQLFAAAFGDVAAYREYPYIVRRRRHDEPGAERSRISGELSEIQRRLNHNRAVLRVESPRVALAYDHLVTATRRVAGQAIREGWDLPPITSDREVHVKDVDLSPIDPYEDAFLAAAAEHLALLPWWSLAFSRRLGRRAALVVRRVVDREEPGARPVRAIEVKR